MSKYGGLKKKWWKSLQEELKFLELPEPAHEHGFTDAQLKESLSEPEYKNFWRWMYGQTLMKSEDGLIIYVDDVIRGVRLIRYGTPTYFD